jgi:type II secretory pathway pseudopilin PulG
MAYVIGCPPIWDAVWSNWALVLVGFLAAAIALRTLKTIATQTAATEKAVIAATRSADAADATLDAIKDTAQRQLRAYLLPISAEKRQDKNVQGEFSVIVTFRNAGQTPAYNCTSWMGVGVSDFPNPPYFPDAPADTGKSLYFMAPNSELEKGGASDPLTPADLEGIRNSTRAIYAHGEICYLDVFNVPRFTKFRMVCTGESFSTGRFVFCGGGNEAN